MKKYSQAAPNFFNTPNPLEGLGALPTGAPGLEDKTEREEIGSPLTSLAMIMYDIDLDSFIDQNISETPEQIATKIWELYGGDELGINGGNGKLGARKLRYDVSEEEEKKEREQTKDQRWKRLPEGKMISDITTFDEISNYVQGAMFDKTKHLGQGGSGGDMSGGGGMPPMPSASPAPSAPVASIFSWYRFAKKL